MLEGHDDEDKGWGMTGMGMDREGYSVGSPNVRTRGTVSVVCGSRKNGLSNVWFRLSSVWRNISLFPPRLPR